MSITLAWDQSELNRQMSAQGSDKHLLARLVQVDDWVIPKYTPLSYLGRHTSRYAIA
jgi:hypothetical protein